MNEEDWEIVFKSQDMPSEAVASANRQSDKRHQIQDNTGDGALPPEDNTLRDVIVVLVGKSPIYNRY